METLTPTLTPADHFTGIIQGVFADITTRAANPWFAIPLAQMVLIKLIWRRLRRMHRRFAAIMAQLRAGTLPQTGNLARPATEAPLASDPPQPRPQQPSQRSGWVIHAVSWFVLARHYQLEEMLEDPQTEELLAAAPQLGRLLRPLCRMLAVKPPAWLRLPPRPRPRIEKFPPAPDWLVNEPGAILHADGTVWMRLGASTNWRPGSGQSLEQARKFDIPRRIWPRED